MNDVINKFMSTPLANAGMNTAHNNTPVVPIPCALHKVREGGLLDTRASQQTDGFGLQSVHTQASLTCQASAAAAETEMPTTKLYVITKHVPENQALCLFEIKERDNGVEVTENEATKYIEFYQGHVLNGLTFNIEHGVVPEMGPQKVRLLFHPSKKRTTVLSQNFVRQPYSLHTTVGAVLYGLRRGGPSSYPWTVRSGMLDYF